MFHWHFDGCGPVPGCRYRAGGTRIGHPGVAWGAVKHMFEKVGDHWEYKDHKGPSDPRSRNPRARDGEGQTFGGVDYEGHTKTELYERAATLGVPGRSKMSKAELAEAIARKQD